MGSSELEGARTVFFLVKMPGDAGLTSSALEWVKNFLSQLERFCAHRITQNFELGDALGSSELEGAKTPRDADAGMGSPSLEWAKKNL